MSIHRASCAPTPVTGKKPQDTTSQLMPLPGAGFRSCWCGEEQGSVATSRSRAKRRYGRFAGTVHRRTPNVSGPSWKDDVHGLVEHGPYESHARSAFTARVLQQAAGALKGVTLWVGRLARARK